MFRFIYDIDRATIVFERIAIHESTCERWQKQVQILQQRGVYREERLDIIKAFVRLAVIGEGTSEKESLWRH